VQGIARTHSRKQAAAAHLRCGRFSAVKKISEISVKILREDFTNTRKCYIIYVYVFLNVRS